MNISFICPTRNNLKYLKWAVDSVIKNKGYHEVEFCIWDDFSSDGTYEWLQNISSNIPTTSGFTVNYGRNSGPNRLGHTILYDNIVKELATNDLCMIWHADMYLCPGALDKIEELMYEDEKVDMGYGEYWTNSVPIRNRIVSLTRIEPPLHPPGPEKIVMDFGIEPENFDEESLLMSLAIPMVKRLDDGPHDYSKYGCVVVEGKITNGVFAPWAFWRDEFLEIGGHDYLYAPQSKEDSDIWNRFLLNGTEFLQTWEGFVYHMTCRGSRFNPTLTTPGKNSSEWEVQNIKSSRNFIRKWGHFVKHTEFLHPIVPHKYNIGFVIENGSTNILYSLEPWCDDIQIDLEPELIDRYIEFEQPNTRFNLRSKINCNQRSKLPDIIVYIDGRKLTQGDFEVLYNLSDIITDSGEENTEMEIGNLKLNIGKMTHYEKNLIYCKND